MTHTEAARILDALARGVDPQTMTPITSHEILSRRDVIGALFLGANALEQRIADPAPKPRRDTPTGAGRAWDHEEEKELIDEFHSGKSIASMAEDHCRTDGAIRSRLVRLGLIPERAVDSRVPR